MKRAIKTKGNFFLIEEEIDISVTEQGVQVVREGNIPLSGSLRYTPESDIWNFFLELLIKEVDFWNQIKEIKGKELIAVDICSTETQYSFS